MTDCLSLLSMTAGMKPKTMAEFEYLRDLDGLAARAKILLRHVKGHAGISGNEAVDVAANEARELQPGNVSLLAPEAVKSELKRRVEEERKEIMEGSQPHSRTRFFLEQSRGMEDARISTRSSDALQAYSRAECSVAN